MPFPFAFARLNALQTAVRHPHTEYEHYHGHTVEEDTENAYEEGSPNDDDLAPLPMPETGDNYISAEVLLPLGSVLRWGKVISHKSDADGNIVGRAHDRPILDTRTYDIEFDDGTIAILTANEIAECMYAQCDPGGNQYVLLDSFVDFDKLSTAIFPRRPEYCRERTSFQALQQVWLEDLLPMEGRLHDMGVPQGPERIPSTRNG